jgi:DNA-binding CsgD family transcriptional regulator
LKLFNSKNNRELALVAEGVRKAFKAVKTELDDHLDATNQNTAEIQANQGLLAELEAKIDKLSERLDELELLINPNKAIRLDVKLTPREQEVFMAIYLSKGLSESDIAKHLGFTEQMVNAYLFNLLSKGVPVRRELVDDVVVFSLDSDFKNIQAKKNVLEIDPRIAKQLALHNL